MHINMTHDQPEKLQRPSSRRRRFYVPNWERQMLRKRYTRLILDAIEARVIAYHHEELQALDPARRRMKEIGILIGRICDQKDILSEQARALLIEAIGLLDVVDPGWQKRLDQPQWVVTA